MSSRANTDWETTTTRVDPAGRPPSGRLRQGAIALAILVAWIFAVGLVFRVTRDLGTDAGAAGLAAIGALAWLATELTGGRSAPIWPASALGITGALSFGLAISLGVPVLHGAPPAEVIAAISLTAALSMAAWLFRFRLPGLVSPVVTFSVVALFLMIFGANADSLSRVEGLSARGVLAALITTPLWAATALLLACTALALARWLDLKGGEFGLASARPLHLIGAGVGALVLGRWCAALPAPWDALALMALAGAGAVWALRINRFAVLGAVHLAIGKPLVIALAGDMPAHIWGSVVTALLVLDLTLWPWLHHIWLSRGWILGPGGRSPTPRPGLWWRYWPYA